MNLTSLRIGFIGAGRLARTLAPAWARCGLVIAGAYSRRIETARALADACSGGAAAFADAQALLDASDLVFLTVPDDAIAGMARALRWTANHRLVHCSAATEVAALNPAAEAGALTGGFHPLQLFADPEVAIGHLAGSTVAIEAGAPLAGELHHLADLLGMRPLTLPGGSRVLYHIAGNLAASGVLGVLREAEDIWALAGLPRRDAMSALLPLTRGTIAAATASGLPGALAGPVSRADLRVVQAHLAQLGKVDAGGTDFYALLLERLVRLGESAGRLDATQAAAIRTLLGDAGRCRPAD